LLPFIAFHGDGRAAVVKHALARERHQFAERIEAESAVARVAGAVLPFDGEKARPGKGQVEFVVGADHGTLFEAGENLAESLAFLLAQLAVIVAADGDFRRIDQAGHFEPVGIGIRHVLGVHILLGEDVGHCPGCRIKTVYHNDSSGRRSVIEFGLRSDSVPTSIKQEPDQSRKGLCTPVSRQEKGFVEKSARI
jgi:hypothetical protein